MPGLGELLAVVATDALELGIEQGGLRELLERRRSARAQGRLYGIGYAAIVEPSMSNMGYITTVLPPGLVWDTFSGASPAFFACSKICAR